MERMTSRSWTPEQIAKLKELRAADASAARSAVALKRSKLAVQAKARELGCPFPHVRVKRHQQRQREQRILESQNAEQSRRLEEAFSLKTL